MGRVDMKLLLQIVVIAVVSYQTIAKSGAVGGICSVFSPGKDWVSQFACDRYTRCRCWVKKSPGSGWKNTGQICDWKSGCTCWTKNISIRCNGFCENKEDQCSFKSPGFGWKNT